MPDKKKPILTEPSLIGKKLYLRPATAEDIANTYHWLVLSDPNYISFEPTVFSTAAEAAEAFKKQERSTNQQQFTVVRQKDNTPVGLAHFFGLNTHNHSARIDLLIDPDERKKGYGLEAINILYGYLFNIRGLNKVYTFTAEYNKEGIKLLKKAGFKKDGTLRHQYLYKREFRDGFVYSRLASD